MVHGSKFMYILWQWQPCRNRMNINLIPFPSFILLYLQHNLQLYLCKLWAFPTDLTKLNAIRGIFLAKFWSVLISGWGSTQLSQLLLNYYYSECHTWIIGHKWRNSNVISSTWSTSFWRNVWQFKNKSRNIIITWNKVPSAPLKLWYIQSW